MGQHHSSACSAPAHAPQAPAPNHAPRPIAPIRRRSSSSGIVTSQAIFLTNLARTDPRQLKAHEALYHDAYYRENAKETPDFALLKKWYLAYFLKQKGQPLNTEQRVMLESGDPSDNGGKRAGTAQSLGRVDELFGEYFQAAKIENDAERTRKTSLQPIAPIEDADVQASQANSQTLSQHFPTPVLQAQSLTPASAQPFNEFFEETVAARTVSLEEKAVSNIRFEIWDRDTIDSGLDRILATGSIYQAQSATQIAEPVPQGMAALRSGISYLSSLPQSLATGNEAVDDEMQKLLEYAYQTDRTTLQNTPEDEQLLRQTTEESKADWQRYCDFYADRESQAVDAPPIEDPIVGEFDFSDPLSEEQLAAFDFEDPPGQGVFAQSDVRIAAAHAANLARH
ncbi:hypothetical protein BU25DRAFT_463813 [Macroventuria anomochaeta]|uniref:Uncharacterized protein n=1 Tax=Macroventuria anomochaeta TaxID=301207 RepID=A0ACB6RJP2_9PLEO|nr:uncharacterized protein BU25DRAFT_463813 [Macroventuria anomochaeta]KAF2621323.1 hypothetical protein BU25DRAFT_463813 [Macroventuria anomochaeta]